MKPISDHELVMHYYSEATDGEAIDAALTRSPELAARFAEIRAVLDAASEVEPLEPPVDYAARLWRRLEPRLERRRPSWRDVLLPDRRWALAAAALLVVIVAFLAGRASVPPEPTPRVLSPGHRILLASVADHLQRTERLLLEIVNGDGSDLDVEAERELARELGGSNRFYRQAARRQGDLRTAALLDEIELTLLRIAHVEPEELPELRRRLDDGDLLFKVRVVRSRLGRTGDGRSSAAATSTV